MGVRFGEIDSSQILQNEFKIMILERVIDQLLVANTTVSAQLNIARIREEVAEELARKYPKSGISLQG